MKKFTSNQLYLLRINTIVAICFFFLTIVATAQKQYISGKGMSNFSEVKKHHTENKFSLIEKSDKFHNKFNEKRNLRLKNSPAANAAKRRGNTQKSLMDTINPVDTTNIYLDFYNYCYYCFDSTCYSTNVTYLYSAEIWTDYFLDTTDITVTFNFGDGTVTTLNPHYGYYYDSSYYNSYMDFIALALHAYSAPGIYYPTCTAITTMGDTVTQAYYEPITINSGLPSPPSIIYSDIYTNQYCWNDSLYYYGTYSFINLYYPSLQSFSDAFTININYGDGTDTTFQFSPNSQMYYYWWYGYYCPPNFWVDAVHNYSQAGTYTILYTVTFPDGTVDTASSVTKIADHCVTVGGKVFIDNNGNCIADTGEEGLPDVLLYIPFEYDSLFYTSPCYYYIYNWAYTDSFGNYRFSFPDICPIDDTIMFDPYYNFYPIINLPISCPSTGYYVFNTNNPQLNYDFALGCSSGFDLQGFIWGWRFRPGFQGYIYPFYGNYQCDSVSGTAKLIIENPGFLTIDSISPLPNLINGDTIIWNFNNISIQDWWNYATVFVTTDTSANEGDTIRTTLIIEPITGDANTLNNVFIQDFIVTNSWDPNEKEVFPKGDRSEGFIHNNDILTYVIHFQNTGSDTAYNISVTDIIDANLNIESMQILTSSHFMQYSKNGNILTFSFPNIMLPDSAKNLIGSQGFVSYSIKQNLNLPEGTVINNTANIYFDYNPAVITNTTVNTVTYLTGIASNNPNTQKEVMVYPNPAKTELFVQFKDFPTSATITLLDIIGRKVYSQPINSSQIKINVTNFTEGLYFLQIQNSENIINYKVVIKSEK